jgi:hypothetical protein
MPTVAHLPSGARGQSIESSIVRKNGTIVPVHVSISQFELYDRQVLLALIHDLTNRKWYENKIQEQASLLELAHEPSLSAAWIKRFNIGIKGDEELYGWTALEAIDGDFGKTAYEDRTSFEAAKKILLEKGCWSGEVRTLTKALRTATSSRKPSNLASEPFWPNRSVFRNLSLF